MDIIGWYLQKVGIEDGPRRDHPPMRMPEVNRAEAVPLTPPVQRPTQRGWPIQIQRRGSGGFYAPCHASMGGEPFPSQSFDGHIDTGADACVISHDVARAAGINLRRLSLDGYAGTASGDRVPYAAFHLDLKVDKLVVKNVRTFVLHTERNGGSRLIGMAFLSRIRWKFENGALHMAPPA